MLVDFSAIVSGKLNSFELVLSDGSHLNISQVVRSVPNRRIVASGQWNSHAVFAKIFFGKKAAYYAKRDAVGASSLLAAGILTPKILYQGLIQNGTAEVIIYEAISDSRNAEDVLYHAAADVKLELMLALVRIVGTMHKAGLIQHDMYAKNFLVKAGQLHAIDGDAVRQVCVLSSEYQKRVNLALLLSKFDVTQLKSSLPLLLAEYQKATSAKSIMSISCISHMIRQQRMRVVDGYAAKKVFRACTDVAVKKTCSEMVAINRSFDSDAIFKALNNPDQLLAGDAKLLKAGNTCTVALAELVGQAVVVKRYNIKSFWHGLSRALRPSRAAASWSNAYRLLMQGIATPRPVALLEKRCWGLRRQAYFIAEYLDAPDALEYMASDASTEAKLAVMRNISDLFYKLYLLRIAHGDCKATNIKIVDGKPVLIDLDSLQQYRCNHWFQSRHARDLRRLLQNWESKSELHQMLKNALSAVYDDDKPLKLAKITSL